MRITYLLAGVAVSAGLVGAAHARNEPPPKPSGIVVHLFGPGSITDGVLPSGPSSPGQASGQPSGSGPAASGSTASATGNQSYVEPTWGDVAHQMFVTGDPNQEGQAALAKGRPGNGGQ